MKANVNIGINIKLFRNKDNYHEYTVPFQEGMNILSALCYIYEELDRTIAYPICLCRMGKCGACAMKVNGKIKLGCSVKLISGETYVLEPIDRRENVRDLIVI